MGVNGRCQVKYEHTTDEEMTREVLNKTLTPGEEGRLTIDTVESCHEYNVSVRCALDQAPWSYWSPNKTVLTKLKNSDVKLDVWRKVSKQHGQINVHIKWKGIPTNCPGTLNFSISHAPYNVLTSSANYTWTLCSNSSCDIILSQGAHRVNLTVFYNGDFLAVDSFYLSAFAEDESDSLFYVKNIDTKHELNGLIVHWTAPSQPVTGYVIDWTHSGNEFDWKRTEFTNATLQGLADKRPYNITVTPLFDHKTGPSTQISGVCSSFANPGNVTIDNLEAYDTSAHVSWSIRQQERCSDAVVNYTIFYGTTDGPKFNVTVTNSNTQEVYLKNLKPGTYYSVHVVARAHSGPSKSSEGQFKTKLFDPRLIYILSITGSILIIFCLCLCCTIRKIYERPVPNPGLSSLALWPQTTHPKTLMSFERFNTPSESICECVYTEEMHQTSIITTCKSTVISDQRNQTIPSPQDYERLYLSARTPHQCSARDSMSRLNSESSQFNPYRSQRADIPVPRTSKQSKLLAMRLQEKTPSYVSLDMFDS
uniref:Fibronectin type-III domain-containing protein n=1 Tax=Neogobius melanostomus TaxID=47308 RepID=A0A8C6SM91_9GOBI